MNDRLTAIDGRLTAAVATVTTIANRADGTANTSNITADHALVVAERAESIAAAGRDHFRAVIDIQRQVRDRAQHLFQTLPGVITQKREWVSKTKPIRDTYGLFR